MMNLRMMEEHSCLMVHGLCFEAEIPSAQMASGAAVDEEKLAGIEHELQEV